MRKNEKNIFKIILQSNNPLVNFILCHSFGYLLFKSVICRVTEYSREDMKKSRKMEG